MAIRGEEEEEESWAKEMEVGLGLLNTTILFFFGNVGVG